MIKRLCLSIHVNANFPGQSRRRCRAQLHGDGGPSVGTGEGRPVRKGRSLHMHQGKSRRTNVMRKNKRMLYERSDLVVVLNRGYISLPIGDPRAPRISTARSSNAYRECFRGKNWALLVYSLPLLFMRTADGDGNEAARASGVADEGGIDLAEKKRPKHMSCTRSFLTHPFVDIYTEHTLSRFESRSMERATETRGAGPNPLPAHCSRFGGTHRKCSSSPL